MVCNVGEGALPNSSSVVTHNSTRSPQYHYCSLTSSNRHRDIGTSFTGSPQEDESTQSKRRTNKRLVRVTMKTKYSLAFQTSPLSKGITRDTPSVSIYATLFPFKLVLQRMTPFYIILFNLPLLRYL